MKDYFTIVELNCVAARLNTNEIQSNLKCDGRINKKNPLIIKLNSGKVIFRQSYDYYYWAL